MGKTNQGRRVRRRRARRKQPPVEGMSLAELAAQAGVTARAARYYLECGALPSPEFRSSRTRYGRDHLLRLRAISALQKEGLLLDAIRRRLTTMSSAELEAYSPPAVAPTAPPDALASLSSSGPVGARWDHVALLPGLELHLRADASPAARRAAREIVEHWVGPSANEPLEPA